MNSMPTSLNDRWQNLAFISRKEAIEEIVQEAMATLAAMTEIWSMQQDILDAFMCLHDLKEMHRLEAKIIRNMYWHELPSLFIAGKEEVPETTRRTYLSNMFGIPWWVQWLVYDSAWRRFRHTFREPLDHFMASVGRIDFRDDEVLAGWGCT